MTLVAVYNAGTEDVLHTVPLKHAVTMLVRNVARVREAVEGEMVGPYERPLTVELVRYVFTKWRYRKTGATRASKRNILLRDRHTCAYCGHHADTVDHVVPRAQGGVTSWENCVAACQPCNFTKDNRTPAQAKMTLRITPFVPTLADLYP